MLYNVIDLCIVHLYINCNVSCEICKITTHKFRIMSKQNYFNKEIVWSLLQRDVLKCKSSDSVIV